MINKNKENMKILLNFFYSMCAINLSAKLGAGMVNHRFWDLMSFDWQDTPDPGDQLQKVVAYK